jgi:hypothetical protein
MHRSFWSKSPGWSKETLKYPVVIKKEWRPDEVMGEACGSFHYHTNADLSRAELQSVSNFLFYFSIFFGFTQ